MKRLFVVAFIAVLLLLTGCQSFSSEDSSTGKVIDDSFLFLNDSNASVNASDDSLTVDVDDSLDVEEPELVSEDDVSYVISVTEGDLVKLDLKAVDPDGDPLTYTFTDPINAQGRWQTQIGDEGRYLVTVTASDGKLSTSEDVLIVVERANRPPVIECPESLTVDEGDTVVLDCNIYDEEGDNILVSYGGWMSSSSKKTSFDDAGEYTVIVRASDGNGQTTGEVKVIVEDVNRPPVIKPIDDITVMETNFVSVTPEVSDPDGDSVRVSFSLPLNDEGEWQTEDGDAGTYEVTVAASDGQSIAKEKFTITVTQINTAPVLKPIDDISVDEGDLIRIPVNAYDPEGDKITVSFSGFMDSQEYRTGYDDAGVYQQTVTVSDGVLSASQTFTITVVDKNRPPVFLVGDDE